MNHLLNILALQTLYVILYPDRIPKFIYHQVVNRWLAPHSTDWGTSTLPCGKTEKKTPSLEQFSVCLVTLSAIQPGF